jgi:hypothetical protein
LQRIILSLLSAAVIVFVVFVTVGIIGLTCAFPSSVPSDSAGGWWCDWGAFVAALAVIGLGLLGIIRAVRRFGRRVP